MKGLHRERGDKLIEGYCWCQKCRCYYPTTNFYKNKSTVNGYTDECKNCFKKYYDKNRIDIRERKLQAVTMLGGKCSNCNFNKYLSSLEFHHIIPEDKLYEINKLLKSKNNKNLLNELNKCCVLCSNCHQAFESSDLMIKFEKTILGYKVIKPIKKYSIMVYDFYCIIEFLRNYTYYELRYLNNYISDDDKELYIYELSINDDSINVEKLLFNDKNVHNFFSYIPQEE